MDSGAAFVAEDARAVALQWTRCECGSGAERPAGWTAGGPPYSGNLARLPNRKRLAKGSASRCGDAVTRGWFSAMRASRLSRTGTDWPMAVAPQASRKWRICA